eukprot:TRINITY_DN10182_c0_g1_i1.p1 TRINITY_DN10182_c0_g1~~TRINITY_DN10182_c0_g1_i1.p1  ORF type:complete len:633 (+),score=238.56 TRINITY_DN10182_c0_g1_i1:100-1899(+)
MAATSSAQVALALETPCPCEGCCELHSCCGGFRCKIAVLLADGFCLASAVGLQTATLTTVEDQLGLNKMQMGVLVSMDDAAILLTGTSVAHHCRGHKAFWIGVGALAMGAGQWLYGVSPNYAVVTVSSFVMGLGKVPPWVLVWAHIDDNVADKTRIVGYFAGMVIALFLGGGIAFAVGQNVLNDCITEEKELSCGRKPELAFAMRGGLTVTLSEVPAPGPSGCERWRTLFFFWGTLCFIPGVWLLQSRKMHAQERTTSPQTAAETMQAEGQWAGEEEAVELREVVRSIFTSLRMLAFLLRTATGSFFGMSVMPFLPWFLENKLCISKQAVTIIIVPIFVCLVLGFASGGRLVQRYGWGVRKQILFVAAVEALGAPLSFMFLTHSAALFAVLMSLYAFLAALGSPTSLNLHQRIVAPEHKAYSSAVFSIVSKIFALPAPIVFGYLLDREGQGSVPSAEWLFTMWSGLYSAFSAPLALFMLAMHVRGGYPDFDATEPPSVPVLTAHASFVKAAEVAERRRSSAVSSLRSSLQVTPCTSFSTHVAPALTVRPAAAGAGWNRDSPAISTLPIGALRSKSLVPEGDAEGAALALDSGAGSPSLA